MPTVSAERRIDAPPESVFDLITDHAGYRRFRGIRGAELLSEGDPPPNGAGAMRRVLIGPFRFDEEITVYERPSRMDYLIVRINMPFEHSGGSMRLSEEDDATRVEWTSTFRVPTPLVGGLQERIWALALDRGFRRVLEDMDRILTSSSA
jgi:uncharacterized protein YndB with AHSA1/START domain